MYERSLLLKINMYEESWNFNVSLSTALPKGIMKKLIMKILFITEDIFRHSLSYLGHST